MSRTSRRRLQRRKRGEIGFVRIRVMADYDSSGLWQMIPTGVFRHAMIGYDALNLPPALRARFEEWIESYFAILEDAPFDYEGFNQTGRELAQGLKQHLGAESYVEFMPENAETGMGTVEVMELPCE